MADAGTVVVWAPRAGVEVTGIAEKKNTWNIKASILAMAVQSGFKGLLKTRLNPTKLRFSSFFTILESYGFRIQY